MCLGVPGQIEQILKTEKLMRMARVRFGGIVKEINVSLVEAEIGDYVIVHAGFAISRIDEQEAVRVFDYLKSIDELDEYR